MQNLDYVAVGKRIRETRKAQELTQEKASERCDITAAYYGNVERGDKKMSIETLAKVSKGLKVSADYLLFGEMPDRTDRLAVLLMELRRKADEAQMEKYLAIIEAIAGVIEKL